MRFPVRLLGKFFRTKAYFAVITIGITLLTILSGVNQLPLQAKPAPQQVASAWKQAFFPVDNFQGYTSLYGNRFSAFNGHMEFHNGLDIGAPLGSYVKSWWSGQIVKVSDNDACGTSVIIQSGEWKHIYCHLSGHVENTSTGRYLIDRPGGIQLLEGQQITAGSRIGRVGMTGRTTGPHLHWGLKYQDKYIDPGTILTQMYKLP